MWSMFKQSPGVTAIRGGDGEEDALSVSRSLLAAEVPIYEGAEVILRHVLEITGSALGFVSSVDPKTKESICHALAGVNDHQVLLAEKAGKFSFPPSPDGTYDGLWGYAFNAGKPFFTNSPESHSAFRGVPQGHIPITNFLAFPVFVDASPIGLIALANAPDGFSDDDLVSVGRIADLYSLFLRRIRYDESVREAHRHYHALFELMVDGFSLLQVVPAGKQEDLLYLDINPAFERLTGLSRDGVVGRTLQEVFPDIDRRSVQELLKVAKTQKRVHLERRLPIFNGYFQLTLFSPCVGQCAVLFSETTDLRLARKKLSESERRLIDLLENVKLAAVMLDGTGAVNFCNEYFLDITGWSREEVIGAPFAKFMTREANCAGALALEGEHHILTRDGEWRLIRWNTTRLRDISGAVTGIASIGEDVTERRKMQDALRESEERLRLLLEGSDDIVSLQDLEGMYLYYNGAYTSGLSSGDIIGKLPAELLDAESSQRMMDRLHQVLQTGSPITYEDAVMRDGKEQWFSHRKYPVRDSEGRIIAVGTIARNISDRVKIEEERLRAQKLESIGLLAGGIAHDFNNMLTAVLGNVSLARIKTVSDLNAAIGLLDEAEEALRTARNLTTQLLTFSKGGAPVRKTASVGDLLRQTAAFVLRGSNVKCVCRIEPDLWTVDVDEGQMNQVMNNLLINADQAMPMGGNITVSAENIHLVDDSAFPLTAGRYVTISVKDQGVGIPEENLKKVFDPYFTTKETGNGLGLATSYSIIRRHDGHITVQSEEGIGTTFQIYLPASLGQVSAKPEPCPVVRGRGRILVMDDEEKIRKVAATMLNGFGYEVEVAEGGSEAIGKYAASLSSGSKFDLVVIDLTIPGGMGGRETIERLLQMDPQVRAIVSSGYSNDEIMADYSSYGFIGILPKPYGIADLAEAISKALQVRPAVH